MKLRINNARLSFHSLAQPEDRFGGTPKYTATLILDPSTPDGKENLENIRNAIRANEKEKLAGKELPLEKTFITDGNTKEYSGWEDKVIISTSNKSRPITVGKQRQAVAEGDPQWFYAGCRVNAVVSIWTMDHQQYGQRHICSLEAMQFAADDTPFSSNVVNVETDFDVLEGKDVETVSADSVFGI